MLPTSGDMPSSSATEEEKMSSDYEIQVGFLKPQVETYDSRIRNAIGDFIRSHNQVGPISHGYTNYEEPPTSATYVVGWTHAVAYWSTENISVYLSLWGPQPQFLIKYKGSSEEKEELRLKLRSTTSLYVNDQYVKAPWESHYRSSDDENRGGPSPSSGQSGPWD